MNEVTSGSRTIATRAGFGLLSLAITLSSFASIQLILASSSMGF